MSYRWQVQPTYKMVKNQLRKLFGRAEPWTAYNAARCSTVFNQISCWVGFEIENWG